MNIRKLTRFYCNRISVMTCFNSLLFRNNFFVFCKSNEYLFLWQSKMSQRFKIYIYQMKRWEFRIWRIQVANWKRFKNMRVLRTYMIMYSQIQHSTFDTYIQCLQWKVHDTCTIVQLSEVESYTSSSNVYTVLKL